MAEEVTEEMEYEVVGVDDVDPTEYNPRVMAPAKIRKLKNSLMEFGWAVPLTVNIRSEANGFPAEEEGHKVIVGGHQRWRCAKELGWDTVPVHWVHYDPVKEKAANIALNNSEISGEWDSHKLAEVLDDIEKMDVALLASTGFGEQQIRQFKKQLEEAVAEPVYPLTPRLMEHYDYVVIFTTNEIDWVNLQEVLKLEKHQSYKKSSVAGLGLCRVVPFEDFMALWASR